MFVQDPETKKEMEEMQAKMSVQNQMPEVSYQGTRVVGTTLLHQHNYFSLPAMI
jgi:hypothetical protein